jgi:2-keto-4-pentenoate hydratase/2-oxohepta-3-ene-1,7-dioic acid hydratase in catechol pathway
MKFIVGTNDIAQTSSVFAVIDDNAINLTELDATIGHDLMGLISRNDLDSFISPLIAGANTVPLSTITPALPLTKPGKIICLGLNYAEHIKEGPYERPDYPAIFMRTATSLIPAESPMVIPNCSETLDYEAELMVIIGKGGRHITMDNALSHVFGYTIFNDGTVREYQRKTHQWTPGKNFDGTGPIGPIIVTPDELPSGAEGLKIETRVSGETLQSSNTSQMIWKVAPIIAEISLYSTLEPGDMIAMGTPSGVGHPRTPPRWLRNGEVIETEIEGIGICRNPIISES